MERFRTEIMNLIKDAMNLHTVIMNSKAMFLLQWLGDYDAEEFYFHDPNSMESMQSGVDKSRRVEFVQAPALLK